MGFRFRKSVKLPGGFRVNLSNSGVGYSWGTKGYRVTKTAKGTTRETITVPGTGISHVRETKTKTSQTPRQSPGKSNPIKQRHGCLTQIVAIPLLLLLIVGIYSGCARSAEEDPGLDRDIPVSTQPEVDRKDLFPSPVQSTTGNDGLTKEERARAYLSEEFNLELVDVKVDASIYQFVVTAAGISDREDQTEAPENWEDIQQDLISAQSSTAKELGMSDQETALVLVDSQNERMLVCRSGVVKQDRYDNRAMLTPSGTQTGEQRVWVTSSGKKYHYSSTCSGMKSPRSMSISEALASGYAPCDKCT